MHFRPAVLLATVLGLVGLAPSLPAAGAAAAAPPGWRLVASETLAPGVEHQTLRMDSPTQDVHVARLAPGTAGRLLPVLAHDVLPGPSSSPEATSSMCTRVKCAAAVNGDFFDPDGRPVGAMVSTGELLTTPGIEHILLRVDGQGRATLRPGIDWRVGVTTADGQALAVQAVNRPLAGDGIVLYSRRWGPSTTTDVATTEVTLQLVPGNAILPTGTTAVRVGPPQAGGNAAIGAGQVVLSGRGAGAHALAQLAQRAAMPAAGGLGALQMDVGGIVSAIGGSPQLLQAGQLAYPADNADDFTQGRHARTVVGMTAAGGILLVTADRGATSEGLTLREAATLLSGLGAVDAVNLDGGGSTTFVGTGTVRNRPGQGQERPVASALTVTAGGPLDAVAALLNQLTSGLTGLPT